METKHAELYHRIAPFKIDEPGTEFTFTARLAKENGWSQDYAERVVGEYKKFAFLAIVAGHTVCPSEQVDQAWHLHLTHTRSYWDRFCQQVLGTPLHHNPSRGGQLERVKFVECYKHTLESYERFLAVKPPADIWPDPETRFGADLHCRRVNTKRNWIIPKVWLNWLNTGTATFLGGLVTIAGCAVHDGKGNSVSATSRAAQAVPNPFDLTGPEFLGFFAATFAVAFVIAGLIRWYMRRSTYDSSAMFLDLDSYEVAYLAGGEEAVINGALASLVSCGALNVEGAERRLMRVNNDFPVTQLLPYERAVLETIHPATGETVDEVHRHRPPLTETAERLKSLGLVVPDGRAWIGRVIPLTIVLAVVCFGAIRILDGYSKDKPAGFLVLACIVGGIAAFAAFGERLHRTSQGDRVFEHLKVENAPLGTTDAGQDELVGGSDLALALGLFGIGVLATGPLKELHEALKPRVEAGGGSGYVSGCGGDGGGCGGGCGGCGGCG